MSEKQRIQIGEDCCICGNELTLITSAKQACEAEICYPQEEEGEYDGHHDWHATEDDKVVCEECGAEGYISVDCNDSIANVSFDEQSDHNTECYIKHRERKAEERGRHEKNKPNADDDFKFEYRSATGSRIRCRINRALLSGSDLDLAKAFRVVADNAFEFGRREENEACAKLLEAEAQPVHSNWWKSQVAFIVVKIRARLEAK